MEEAWSKREHAVALSTAAENSIPDQKVSHVKTRFELILRLAREGQVRISTRTAKTRLSDLREAMGNPERWYAVFSRSLKQGQFRHTTVLDIDGRRTANMAEIL